MVIILVL